MVNKRKNTSETIIVFKHDLYLHKPDTNLYVGLHLFTFTSGILSLHIKNVFISFINNNNIKLIENNMYKLSDCIMEYIYLVCSLTLE